MARRKGSCAYLSDKLDGVLERRVGWLNLDLVIDHKVHLCARVAQQKQLSFFPFVVLKAREGHLGILEALHDGDDRSEILERRVGKHANVLCAHVNQVEANFARCADTEADV